MNHELAPPVQPQSVTLAKPTARWPVCTVVSRSLVADGSRRQHPDRHMGSSHLPDSGLVNGRVLGRSPPRSGGGNMACRFPRRDGAGRATA